jgi:hypothetical protein
MPSRAMNWLVFALTIVWGAALLAGVAVLQRPRFTPEVASLSRLLWAVAVAVWIGAAGLGLGWGILRGLALPASVGERWLVAALLGLGAVGLAWLVVGMARVPPAWLSAVLLAAPLALLARWREPLPAIPRLPRLLWLLLVVMGVLSFLQALEPPTAFDALMYHLRLPELWLAEGSLFQSQKSAHFFFPVLVEALFTPALQLGGEGAATLLHWVYLPLTLGMLWQMTRRFLPSVSAPLVLALAITIQMLPLLAGWAYTDVALAAYQVGVVWALLHWRAHPESRWHWAAALFAGMAMGIKYLSFLTPLLALVFIVAARGRRALPALAQFALLAGVVASPSYLRNLIGTSNPFFPFALPSPYWDDFRATWYAAAGTGIGWSLPDLLAVPWTATLGLRDANYDDGRPGPLIATFTPLAFWFWLRRAGRSDERKIIGILAAFALSYVALWLVGIVSSAALWQTRFLATPLLLLCPVVAWGIGQLEPMATRSFSPARFAYLFVGGWAVLATLIALMEFFRTAPVQALMSYESREAWLESRIGSYELLVQEMNALPAGSRALFLFEPRSYRMPVETWADTVLYEYSWRLHRLGGDAVQLTPQLCEEGFTHAAIYWRGARFLNQEDAANDLSDAEFAALEAWAGGQESLWLAENGQHELLRLACEA